MAWSFGHHLRGLDMVCVSVRCPRRLSCRSVLPRFRLRFLFLPARLWVVSFFLLMHCWIVDWPCEWIVQRLGVVCPLLLSRVCTEGGESSPHLRGACEGGTHRTSDCRDSGSGGGMFAQTEADQTH